MWKLFVMLSIYNTQKGFCGLENGNSRQPKSRAKIALSLARPVRRGRQGKTFPRPDI